MHTRALFLLLFFLLLTVSAVSAQINDRFVMAASFGTVTAVDDSSHTADLSFQADQLGAGFLANQIQVGWRVITSTRRQYRVSAVNSASFSSANLTLIELPGTTLAPSGVAAVYQYDGSTELIPLLPVNSTGISAAMSAILLIHNFEELSGLDVGGAITSLPDSSITLTDPGGDFASTTLDDGLVEILDKVQAHDFAVDTLTAIGNASGYVYKWQPSDAPKTAFTGTAATGYTITPAIDTEIQQIDFIGDSGTSNASGELVLYVNTTPAGTRRRFSVQIYDLSNDQKVDEHLTGNVVSQTVAGLTTEIVIPNVAGNYPNGILVQLR